MNTNWSVRGEIDLGVYGSIAELQLGIPLLILFLFCKSVLNMLKLCETTTICILTEPNVL